IQRTDESRVWSGLQISVAAEARAFFDASIFVKVGNGRRTLFWRDRWVDGTTMADLASTLTAAIPKRTARSLTVADGMADRLWVQGIVGGLTVTIPPCVAAVSRYTYTSARRCGGPNISEVVEEWSVLRQIGPQSATLGFAALPWQHFDLGNLDTLIVKDIRLASAPKKALDARLAATAWT
ncbi:hypothetical protein BS78_01G177100, partial [Paspalum vaginatum]